MRLREQALGNKNVVGAKIEKMRREKRLNQREFLAILQVRGMDISASTLSKIEGQHRTVTDKELIAIADVLSISIDELTGRNKIKRQF